MSKRRNIGPNELFEFEKLEDRRVLDANFLLGGSQLILNGWAAADTLTIREDAPGDAYIFELAIGTWNGVDGSGVQGNGLHQLRAAKSTIDALASGIQVGEAQGTAMFDTVFESVDFSGLDGLFLMDTISIRQAVGSTLLTADAQFGVAQELILATNATFRANGDVLLLAGSDIRIGHEVAAGQPAAARITGAARFEATGNLEFVGNTQRLSFSAGGTADITEKSALVLFGNNQTGGLLQIDARRAMIADYGTDIVAPEMLLAGKFILLGTSPQDSINVGGFASLSSSNGIYLASQATIHIGELQFNSGGFIHATVDSDIRLVGSNTADATYIKSSGSVTDSPTTTIHLNGNLMLDAWAISLAENPANELVAAGRATLTAPQLIAIGASDVLVNPNAATVAFGQLKFVSEGYVTINESDGMYLIGTNQAAHFDLRSRGYLQNAPGLDLNVESVANFQSNEGIYLGNNSSDTIHVCGETHFSAPQQVTVGAESQFTTPVYFANSGHVDINRDATSCDVQHMLEQLNDALPDGWSYQLYDDGPDIRLVTYDANGNAATRVRFGSAGVISSVVDARTGRNLLAPSYQGEVTDRVVQWTIWEVGKNAVYDVPGLPGWEDRFNMTQAGTFSGALQGTTDVELNSAEGQLDVWAVVDRQWKSELEPFMDGEITTLTRTQMLDGGGMLVRRVLQLGETRRLGTQITIDSPYLVGWNTFSDSVFDSLAISIDAQGNPDVWWDDSQIPYFPNTRVNETRGWATVYDRDNLASGQTMSVIFGNEEGIVHKGDGTTGDPRYFVYNSMNFDGGMAINPGLATWQMPVGTIVDQYYLILPGQGIDAETPVVLDELAERLPAPQIYHPGSTLPADVAEIADRLSQLASESRTATDHIGTLL